jgi:hypothetical protein
LKKLLQIFENKMVMLNDNENALENHHDEVGNLANNDDNDSQENQNSEISENILENISDNISESTQENTLESVSENHHEDDYSDYSKEELAKLIEKAKNTNLSAEEADDLYQVARKIKPLYDEIVEQEREQAKQKFVTDNGSEDGFEYKLQPADLEVFNLLQNIKKQHTTHKENWQKTLQKNYDTKVAIVEKLRKLTSNPESEHSYKDFKQIENEWKAVGAMPKTNATDLWKNYNALRDIFYSQSNFHQQLKELDRKRNQELKEQICLQAEQLFQTTDLKIALKQLRTLQYEFNHTGPIASKELQETLTERFKKAVEAIVGKRREQISAAKMIQEENLKQKLTLCEQVKTFEDFRGLKPKEWNDKSQELSAIQKNWYEVGVMPRMRSRDVSKDFWASIKTFYKNKSEFFKGLDNARSENLKAKIAICEQAEKLISETTDANAKQITEQLKKLQASWKEIGAVPETERENITNRLKVALDGFFTARREKFSETTSIEKANLDKKYAICDRLAAFTSEELAILDINATLNKAFEEWNLIGFVPLKQLGKIKDKFAETLRGVVQRSNHLSSQQKDMTVLEIELKLAQNYGKGGAVGATTTGNSKDLEKREQNLRKSIGNLEDEIATLNNNMGFFTYSKNAGQFREEVEAKVKKANVQLQNLQNQLKLIRQALKR